MKKAKLFIKNANHTLYTLMTALLFLWCGSMSVSAEGTGTKDDPYIWTDQTEGFATADGAQVAATGYRLFAVFTPQTDGILVISSIYSQFTDNTFSTKSETQPVWDGKYPQQAKLQCTAGNTYYVGGSMPSSTVTVKYLAEAEPLKLTACSPEDGGVFNVIKGTVDLEFNQKVSVSGCLMTFGNQTLNPELFVTNAYVSANAKAMLMAAYNNGSLHEGDDIKFTFSGIKSLEDNSLLNGTGTFEVTYKASAKPMSLVSSVNTPSAAFPVNDFKSYYMKDDATGTVTVTFSETIGSVDGVTLTFGNIDGTGEDGEASQYYREEVSYNIIDNNIIIDLKGKLRRFADMLPGVDISTVAPAFQDRFKTMNLLITGVKDANGNLAYSDGQGTLGSYGFVYNFKEIEYTVAGDWAVDGNAINSDTKNVELWMQETGGNAAFTGVKFAYKEDGADKTAVVPFNEITVADDTETAGAKIYTIPVPNVKMDAGTVTVSLDGAEAPDGAEHADYSAELTCNGRTAAVASEFAVTKAEWTDGTNTVNLLTEPIEALTKSSTISFAVNAECGYAMLEITKQLNGSETKEVLKSGTIYPASITTVDGVSSFVYTVRGAAVNVTKDATFNVTVKAWKQQSDANGPGLNNPNVGVCSFDLISAGDAYVYSDVILQSHISEPYILMDSEETTYTLEFSGPATVKKAVLNEGNGMSSECEVNAVEGTEDKTWIVTIPASALSESQILINVFAEDKEHRAINKALDYTCPTDGGDNVWLPIILEAEFNKPAFTVEPASESVVDKIDVITFSYSKPINPSYAISDKIKIMTDNGRTLLYKFGFNDVKRPEGYEGTDKMCIVLDEPITTPGNYTIDVPSGFFNLGEEFEGASSRAATIYYEIKGSTGVEIKVTPESESVVESLDKIVFTYEPGINVNWGESEGDKITVYNKETRTEVASFTKDDVKFPDDFFDVTNVRVEFAEPITAAGIYEVTVPAGFFSLGESGDNVNETMVIYYEIKSKQPGGDGLTLTANPAAGTVAEIPATIVISADCSEAGFENYELMPTLVGDNNVSYALDVELGVGWNEINIILKNGSITADGTYTLTIPAGAISGDGKVNEETVIVYIIGTGVSGIDNIVANAGGKVDVYTVNGVNVLHNADAAAVKALAKGLYIINGKKVVIK